jgi:hypothetical protein
MPLPHVNVTADQALALQARQMRADRPLNALRSGLGMQVRHNGGVEVPCGSGMQQTRQYRRK